MISVMAKAANKPFYAVVESYKFVRVFPLNQYDLPAKASCNLLLEKTPMGVPLEVGELLAEEHPSIDYTPPSYITLLFTDIGVLTPSGVSDELIKLYY
jgi:translation initiation factor eIF-2B subunit alpha